MRPDQIALQLYSVRTMAALDLPGTLRKLASVGYRAFEFAGLHGVAAAEIRSLLDELGLSAPSAHVNLDALERDAQQAIGELKTLGCAYAVIPSAPRAWFSNQDELQSFAATLNRWGATLGEQGLQLAYHNHEFEFVALGDSTAWEQLVAATNPALVGFELDVYWAQIGGLDPVALIERYGARLPLLHMKDAAPDTQAMANVGEGVLPWARILSASQAVSQWYIVEHDHAPDPLADVASSLHFLEQQATA